MYAKANIKEGHTLYQELKVANKGFQSMASMKRKMRKVCCLGQRLQETGQEPEIKAEQFPICLHPPQQAQ